MADRRDRHFLAELAIYKLHATLANMDVKNFLKKN
jgi:hypothetical protein